MANLPSREIPSMLSNGGARKEREDTRGGPSTRGPGFWNACALGSQCIDDRCLGRGLGIGTQRVDDDQKRMLGVVALDDHVIDLLWIRADRRGLGIGSRLMERAESILATDHDVAELECFAPNHASIAFYEARGYVAVRTYFEAASGVDKVVMTKRLRPIIGADSELHVRGQRT